MCGYVLLSCKIHIYFRMVNVNAEKPFPPEHQYLLKWILPTLIQGLKEENRKVKIQAASVLAMLLQGKQVFQKMAADVGALQVLWNLTPKFNFDKKEEEKVKLELQLPLDDSLVYYALQGIASLIAYNEEQRKAIFDKNGHKALLKLVGFTELSIRQAACHCLIHLARGEKFLKGLLIEVGVIEVLNKLLNDKDEELQVLAISAISNLALEYQDKICENERCLSRIINSVDSMNSKLRYRGIFAIKNLLFKANSELKKRITFKLGLNKLITLFDDENQQTQIQAICTMRYIMHEKNDWISEVLRNIDVDKLIEGIIRKIDKTTPNLLCQALYLLCNMVTLDEKYKTKVWETDLKEASISLLDGTEGSVKLAVMNFLINILWKPKDDQANREQQRRMLKELGAETKLNELAKSGTGEVSLRAAQTLAYFN